MRIVTNPGCNLPAAAIRHFDLEICPQQIVVDGVSHDTRAGIPYPVIDGWVRTARDFPHVVGTTAHEFAAIFSPSFSALPGPSTAFKPGNAPKLCSISF